MNRFPNTRLRRLREIPVLRDMLQETRLSIKDFVYPVFVTEGNNIHLEIEPLPGQFRMSLDRLEEEIIAVEELGIQAVLLFGIPNDRDKDDLGSSAYQSDGIIQNAIREVKRVAPDIMVVADVCLCEYTDHGHCGVIQNNLVDNDQTLEVLSKTALSQVAAGADVVAPSAMMDGQVHAIRSALDLAGYGHTPVMSYSAKYASSFYGPFRVAANSAPKLGNRSGYQLDHPNIDQAMREIETDVIEGADIVMVKPALAYLDVISRAKGMFNHPIAAYNVSGEYAMVKAASENQWIDGTRVMIEVLTAIKRAGADIIISYHAKEMADILRQDISN